MCEGSRIKIPAIATAEKIILKMGFSGTEKKKLALVIAVASMSHMSEPCPPPQGGGRAVPLSEPLWQSAVAAVAGKGGMYVCVESDAALLA